MLLKSLIIPAALTLSLWAAPPELEYAAKGATYTAPPPDMTYYANCLITGYDDCKSCNGKWYGQPTASGTDYEAGRTVAHGSLPFGTEIYIEGLGYYIVEDRGVTGDHVDVYCDTHADCYAITQHADVYIVNQS